MSTETKSGKQVEKTFFTGQKFVLDKQINVLYNVCVVNSRVCVTHSHNSKEELNMKYAIGSKVSADIELMQTSNSPFAAKPEVLHIDNAEVIEYNPETNKYLCDTNEFKQVWIAEAKIDAGMKTAKAKK